MNADCTSFTSEVLLFLVLFVLYFCFFFGDVFVFLWRRSDERARERDLQMLAQEGRRRGRLTACRGQGCLLSGGEKHPESAKKKKKSINS